MRSGAGGTHPTTEKASFVCGQPQERSAGEHFDQGAKSLGLQYIQSVTSFVDQSEACT